jgi:hypothetical protein
VGLQYSLSNSDLLARSLKNTILKKTSDIDKKNANIQSATGIYSTSENMPEKWYEMDGLN